MDSASGREVLNIQVCLGLIFGEGSEFSRHELAFDFLVCLADLKFLDYG